MRPGAVGGVLLRPALLSVVAWFVALSILWTGWKIFLPGADTPFVRIDGFAILYFGMGRLIYFCAPILIGWGIGLIAARQRLQAVWPAVGLILIALIGGTAQVHASRTTVPGGLGHISLDFALGPSTQGISDSLIRVLVILSLTALPYLILRLQKALSLST